jgi:hypothetical protein
MVVATSQLKKYVKTQLVQIILWITIQVPFKPNLASYKVQLKKIYVANIINIFFLDIIRTTTIGCLLKRWWWTWLMGVTSNQ